MLKEECALFGVINLDNSAYHTYNGLLKLQHRGEEATGISTSNNLVITTNKGSGLVLDFYNKYDLIQLVGRASIGHNRYSTTSSKDDKVYAQPLLSKLDGKDIALAHNGHIINANDLKTKDLSIDSEVILNLIIDSKKPSLVEKLRDILPHLVGSFSILILYDDKIYAVRDPKEMRPLSYAKFGDGYIIASESCAFYPNNEIYVDDILGGTIVEFSDKIKTYKFDNITKLQRCIFETIYFSSNNSHIFNGLNVSKFRKELGHLLYESTGEVNADIVTPIPDSGIIASLGYSEAINIAHEFVIDKNIEVNRTFISPTQSKRKERIEAKFIINRSLVENRDIIVVDDSLVRGNTALVIVKLLKESGAKSVHLRIASPPLRYPCFYGIDIPSSKQLAVNGRDKSSLINFLGCDSLEYISLDLFMSKNGDNYCYSCFSGESNE